MRGNISLTSRDQIEVYQFSLPVSIGVPLLALLLQSFLPTHFRFMSLFDLPLLVTIFFGVARRNQISGMALGGIIGIVQDSLTHHPLGVFGIAKTVVGYGASSLGVKIDVENPGSRLLMTFGFTILHGALVFLVMRFLVSDPTQPVAWRWLHEVGSGAANGLLAIVLFSVLDKFKQRG